MQRYSAQSTAPSTHPWVSAQQHSSQKQYKAARTGLQLESLAWATPSSMAGCACCLWPQSSWHGLGRAKVCWFVLSPAALDGRLLAAGMELSDEGVDDLPPEQRLVSDALLRGHVSE